MKYIIYNFLLCTVAFACVSPKSQDRNVEKVKNSPPNIVLIMADDMGYSDLGCYGSEIHTPYIDQLAKEGIKFTQFHNASVCCPSRASLLTGIYPHQAGVGFMVSDWGHESYQGRIKHDVFTLAEALSKSGYTTIMSGKWHLGTREGDNPWERGFDEFYGLPKGGGVYFWPTSLDRDVIKYTKSNGIGPVKTQPDSATFYSTDAFTDYVVDQIDSNGNEGKPLFIYVAYIAPHFPQQAREEDIQKYLGKYKKGWEILREERYKRQVKLGIIDPKYPLSPGVGLDWDTLSTAEKNKFDRQMAVYAAQVDVLDQNVGRILKALDRNALKDNTMVIFLSDNGAQRNDQGGFEKKPGSLFGSKNSYGGYARGWGNLSNTPFRRFKLEEHNGGNRTPFIVRWPAVLKNKNQISRQVGHIIDIFPTLLAAAGVNPSEIFEEDKGQELEGINLLPYLKNTTLEVDRQLYWEHRGNRAVRNGDWKLVAAFKQDWELYNLAEDATELEDISSKFPDKVEQLSSDYEMWARRTGVLPWPVKKLKQ